MRRRYAFFIIFILATLIAFIAFHKSAKPDSVPIGSILVLSGNYKSMGEQIRDGQMLAIEELNADPNRKKKLELLVQDSEGQKTVALQRLQALRSRGTTYIAEIFGSTETLHCLPYIKEQRMLLVSGVDTGASLTRQGGHSFFRTIPSDALAAQYLAEQARAMGHQKAALVYVNDVWGHGLREEMEHAFTAKGGHIVSVLETVKNQDMFQPTVARLKAEDPDITFVFLYARDAAVLIKEARRAEIKSLFMGTDNFTGSELAEVGGAAIQGVMYAVPSASGTTPASSHFRALYQAKFGSAADPPLFAIQGYDVIHILAQAIDASDGDVDRATDYLEKLKYTGVGGPIEFRPDHELANTDYRLKIYQQKPEGLVAVVYGAGPK